MCARLLDIMGLDIIGLDILGLILHNHPETSFAKHAMTYLD